MDKAMKLFNKYILLSILFCAVVSCQEKEQDDDSGKIEQTPIFPEKIVDDKVVAGQKLTLTFTPNLDWELSIDKEASQFFKLIASNGRQNDKVSGKASEEPVTVSIWVNPLEEYGMNRSCVVTMSMGGKSQVVAEYMRPAKQKTMEVYVAKIENGEYVKDDAGNYIYHETEAQELSLTWSAEEAMFMLPIKFVSNCQWDIDRISFPEWLKLQVPEKTDGILHLVLTGVSFDATEGEVSFLSGSTALKKLNASVPSCSGLDLYYAESEDGEWVYDEEGYKYSEEPHESVDMVWTGTDFRLPVMVDSKCEWTVSCPEWASVEYEENDNKRAGIDHLTIKANPTMYPEDDASAKISFSFKGKLLKDIQLNISGCRNIITYSFSMSITQPEFNFSGQYKTTAGYMDAPLSGTVMSLVSMSHRAVEIKDGKFVEAEPQWLKYDIFQDQDTDTRLKLQNRTMTIEVESTEAPEDRKAYIFLLPLPVSEVASLFEEDGCTVKEEYEAYCVPVVQTGKPADYLTPEFSVEDMEEGGASIVRSADNGLYEDAIFGATDYAYEMVYKNMWSDESANVYLTYPYETIDFYDTDKNKITDTDNFWLTFKDYQEDKSYGTFEIRTDTENYEPVTAFAVFKDAEGKSLCVVKFSYVPEIPEEPQEPEIPAGQGNILMEDASHYFADPQAASEAGATLELITGIYIPTKPVTVEEPVKPGDDASAEELATYQEALEAWTQYKNQLAAYTAYEQLTSYQKSHLLSLSQHFKECSGVKAPLLKLTYKSASTKLRLDSEELRKGKASQFSVNPSIAAANVKINNKLMNDVGGKLADLEEGNPRFEMIPIDFEPGSSRDIEMQSTALVVLFYDDDTTILLGVYCELDI